MSRADDPPLALVERLALAKSPPGESVHARAPWPREIVAGAVASVATLAVVLTLGLLSFAPLGAAVSSLGVTAAFVSATLGGGVYALLGRSAMPVGGPSSATALIVAALAVQLARDPAVSLSSARDLAAILSLLSATVILMGVMQTGFGALGFGRLAKFVPQPVLAGFMNGVAVLIVLSQLPSLLGIPAHDLGSGSWLAKAQPFALGLGLATAVLTGLAATRWPRLPAPLIGLTAGLTGYTLLKASFPGLPLGEAIGPLPDALPSADLALRLMAPETAALGLRHAADILATALILALISSLESVLGALGIDQAMNTRHDAGHELIALGVGNVVAGFFGGLPLVLLRSRALATLRAGGRGRRAAFAGAVGFGVLYLLCGPALAFLPKPVLAGIMVTIAFGLIDRWTHQLVGQLRAGERSAEAKQSLLVVAIVCGVTIWQGFVIGVAVGVLASLLVFIRSMNRSLVRARFNAAARPSRRLYPPDQEQFLAEARRLIELRELEGALFFGSADRLAVEADALDPGCRYLIVDFKRVSTIDESGAVLLQQLSGRLRRRGISLLMSGVTEKNAHGVRLRAFGCFREGPRDDWFPDADYATEAAEQALLSEAGTDWGDVRVPLEACTLFRALTPPQVTFVREHMEPIRLDPGAQLFRQNDPADRLYVLTRGSISIVANAGGEVRQRFVSFSPGVMLGETAMLDGGGRSANATADKEAEIYALTIDSLDAIVRTQPEIGARLHRNIATHLSDRLRRSTALQSTDGS